jgi:8-oxo-dGTP diphosphatase
MRDVAVGILLRDGKVLACQRNATVRYALKWEFPGGKIETGETAREALERELREELSVRIVRAEPFHVQEWTYPDSAEGANDGKFRVQYFTVPAFEGEPVNHVFARIRWVTLDELSTLDLLEGNRDAVALLGSKLASGQAKQ